jgi:hypothetical protein
MITPQFLTKRLRKVEPKAQVQRTSSGWQFRRHEGEEWMPLPNGDVYAACSIHNIVAAYLSVKYEP